MPGRRVSRPAPGPGDQDAASTPPRRISGAVAPTEIAFTLPGPIACSARFSQPESVP